MQLTDAQIITYLQSGEETLEDHACRALYRQYYGLVESLTLKNGLAKDATKDIFQKAILAFITMVQRLQFKLTSTVKTLLYSISQNIVRNRLRTLGRTVEFQSIHQSISVEDTIENQMVDKEKKDLLQQLLIDMGEDCQKVLELYYFNKFSMKKMQVIFGDKSEAVTKNRKSRCLQRLRKKVLTNKQYMAILK